ncbi:MAG: cation transporter [Thermodesulfovibrionales bacterium]
MQNNTDRVTLYKWASNLAVITIGYNILEGIISIFFGIEDETLALFGFGLDSFVEVISGAGIWHMVKRIRDNGNETLDRFESQALKITGVAFYILSFGLIVSAINNISQGHKPETTLWGVIISSVSILVMWVMIHYKTIIGKALQSEAILADASCAKTCIYLSVILLIASIGYEITGIGGIDAIGAIGIAIFSFREGREAFMKSKGEKCCCQDTCGIKTD